MKRIINVETGETIERELTKAEKDQQKIDEAAYKLNKDKAKAEETAKSEILDRLGLTTDDLRALGL